MNIIEKNLNDIKPYEKNPRKNDGINVKRKGITYARA